jgi:hypothetical protein
MCLLQSLSHGVLCYPFCSVGTVTRLRARRPKNRILASVRDFFLLSEASKSAVGPTWLSTGDSFPGIKVAVTCIWPFISIWLRMSAALLPLCHGPSWHAQGQLDYWVCDNNWPIRLSWRHWQWCEFCIINTDRYVIILAHAHVLNCIEIHHVEIELRPTHKIFIWNKKRVQCLDCNLKSVFCPESSTVKGFILEMLLSITGCYRGYQLDTETGGKWEFGHWFIPFPCGHGIPIFVHAGFQNFTALTNNKNRISSWPLMHYILCYGSWKVRSLIETVIPVLPEIIRAVLELLLHSMSVKETSRYQNHWWWFPFF